MSTQTITINVITNAGATTQVFQKLGADAQGLGQKLGTIGPAANAAVEGVKRTGEAAKQSGAHLGQFEQQTNKSSKAISSFGEKFAANRGIVFGVAGLASALAEAAGMMGMLTDTQQRAAEAQQALNELREEGVTSGKALADAEAEVVKQNRFLNMVTRNTILSQMDMVFFSTMVVNGLLNMNREGGVLHGTMTKLKTAFLGVNRPMQTGAGAVANFMTNMMPLPGVMTTTEKGTQKLGASMGQMGGQVAGAGGIMSSTVGRVLAFSGALAGIGMAAFGMYEVIKAAEEMKTKLSEIFAESIMKISNMSLAWINLNIVMGTASKEQIQASKDIAAAQKIEKEAMDALGFSYIEVFFNINGAGDKLLAKMKEIATGRKDLGNVIVNEAAKEISGTEAVTMSLKEQQEMMKAILPHAVDISNAFASFGLSAEQAKDQVDKAVDAMGIKNKELAQFLKDFLHQAYDQLIKDAKDLAKENDNVQKAFTQMSGMEKYNQLLLMIAQGSTQLGDVNAQVSRGLQVFANIFADDVASKAMTAQQAIAAFKQEMLRVGIDAGVVEMIIDKLNVKYKDQAKEANNVEKAEKKLNAELEKQKEALAESIAGMQERNLEATQNVETNNAMIKAYDGLIKSVIDEGNAIMYERSVVEQLTEATKQQVTEANNLRLTQAAVIPILEEGFIGQQAYTNAVIEGTQAYSDFMQGLLAGNVAQNTTRDSLIKYVDETEHLNIALAMTDDELRTYAEMMNMSRNATVEFVRAQQEASDASLEFFDSLTGAENMKEFGKAWKELDLGAVPKKLRDDFKDMMKDFRDGAEKGKELQVAMNLATIAIDQLGQKGAEINLDELKDTFKEIQENYDDFIKTDPEGVLLQGFVNELDNLSKVELQKMPLTMAAFNEAMKDNNITWDEFIKIQGLYKTEMGQSIPMTDEGTAALDALNTSTGESIDPNDKLARQIHQISINQSIYARTVVQTTKDIIALTTATDALYKAQTDLSMQQSETNPFGMNGKDSYWNYWSFEGFQDDTNKLKGNERPDSDAYKSSREQEEKYRRVGLTFPGMDTTGQDSQKQAKAMWDPMAMAAGEASKQVQTVFSAMFTALNGIFSGIAKHWSAQMNSMGTNAASANSQVQTQFSSMFVAVNGIFDGIAQHWGEVGIGLIATTSSVSSESNKIFLQMTENAAGNMNALNNHWSKVGGNMAKITKSLSVANNKIFSQMVQNAAGNMNDLAKHWSGVCNSMIRNAKSAASGIKSALKSIPDEEVQIKIKKVMVNSEGGVFSAAEGAVVSAKSGLTTSNGPTTFLYGDNPGGRETMAFIPHDNPDRMMDILDAMFGRTKGNTIINAGGDRDITIPIQLNINGEQYSFTKKYRLRQGQDMAQQVF